MQYEAEFQVPVDFGEIGAILVVNEHVLEMYLKDIVLDGLPNGLVTVTCESWVQPNTSNDPRIFFTNKVGFKFVMILLNALSCKLCFDLFFFFFFNFPYVNFMLQFN